MKKTKVICTIGPHSTDKNILKEMILSGMNVARLNLSHATYEFCDEIIKKINELNEELGTFVSILIDTKGPEVRVRPLNGGKMKITEGDKIKICKKDVEGCDGKFSVTYEDLSNDIKVGDKVLLDDGKIELEVTDILQSAIKCNAINSGVLKTNKSVNIPNVMLKIPFLSEKDKEDITYAATHDVDFLALSYVTSKEDVLEVSDLLIELDNEHIQLIAKIEDSYGVENMNDIVDVSDGVMVARGDLGVEVAIEKLPGIQKEIVELCHRKNKISIVATQMLDSMEDNIKPTRAEVTDIHNAVLDGTDAIMLSGETTVGKYPVQSVEVMSKVAVAAEEEINYLEMFDRAIENEIQNITCAISSSVVNSAYLLKAKVIVASTTSGYTARKVSQLRPICPIIATTPNYKTAKSLALNWGVHSVKVGLFESTDEIVGNAVSVAKEVMDLDITDKIIITGGVPVQKAKRTNFMKIESVE